MQGCLRIGSSTAASGRPTTSAAPPGGNGLMKVMARVGKASSAKAGQAVSAAAAAALPATKRRLSTESSQEGLLLPGFTRMLSPGAVGNQASMIATALVQPADPPRTFTGKQ